MRIFNRLPLRGKLILLMFISNFILVLFMSAFLLYRDFTSIKRNTVETAKSEIASLNQQFAKIILLDSPHYAADLMASLREMENVKKLILFDRNNKAILHYARDRTANLLIPQKLPEAPEFKPDGLYISAAIIYDETKYGTVYMLFSTDLLNEKIINSITLVVILFIIALIVSIALSFLFQQIFSKPILYLANVLNHVTKEKNFDLVVESDERNEIGVLYENFNKMVSELHNFHNELMRKNRELENHRHRLENLVQLRTLKLKRYTDELESFSYSVSHDLRSPLRAINGYCKLLTEEYQANLDQTAIDYLDRISASTCRMGNLIDDLLTLSRITRFELKRRKVDFSELCRSIIATDLFNAYYLHIKIDIQQDMVLFGDEKLLRIMMENLISNAAKYSQYQPDPEISISLKYRDNNQIIVVTDNGVGFDEKYAGNLFKPFQRLHASSRFEGTGIGLTIVQRIAQRHGGEVWATSTLDVGSTFYTSMPNQIKNQLSNHHQQYSHSA